MKRPRTFTAVLTALLLLPALLSGLTFSYVKAQGCAVAAYVTVKSDVKALNVRATPENGTVLGTVPGGTTMRVINVDQKSCWYQVEKPAALGNVVSNAYWVTYSANYVTISTATPSAATETRIPTQTLTPTPTLTQTPRPSPTQIITNTPLPAGYMATQAKVIAREICWKERDDPPNSRGTCFLVPLDAVISDTVAQIQP